MSTIACKYHAKVPARWRCDACDVDLCTTCAKKDVMRNEARCPLCSERLEPASASNYITPFWERIHQFFIYPTRLAPLLLMGVLALVFSFVPSFLGILDLVCALAFYKYAFAVLEGNADGRSEPPAATLDTFTTGLLLPLKQAVVFVLMGAAVYYTNRFAGVVPAAVLAIFFFLCVPASIMVLAVEQSLVSAINPMMLVGVIRRIGWSYLLLYVFLGVTGVLGGIVTVILSALPWYAGVPLQHVVSMYTTLVGFGMMGYVIYQYHEALGYQVPVDLGLERGAPQEDREDARPQPSPALSEVEVLLREDRMDDALEKLRAGTAQDSRDLALHDRYHRLLMETQRHEELLRHAREYINILLYEGKAAKAAEVFRACYRVDSGFKPADPDRYYSLASVLRQLQAHKEVLGLITDFHRAFPKHPDVPRLYLLAAQVYSEALHRDDQATRILRYLVARYPGHELQPQIQHYLEALTRMA